MHKVRIQTIRGFCCANLGSELLRNNPRIAHANLGSRIVQPNLGHPWQQTHNRSRMQSSSAIRVNEATIDRARLRARSIVGLLPRMAEVWLRDPRRLHADPRFAQQNPRMVRIRTSCITYIYTYIPGHIVHTSLQGKKKQHEAEQMKKKRKNNNNDSKIIHQTVCMSKSRSTENSLYE